MKIELTINEHETCTFECLRQVQDVLITAVQVGLPAAFTVLCTFLCSVQFCLKQSCDKQTNKFIRKITIPEKKGFYMLLANTAPGVGRREGVLDPCLGIGVPLGV